MKFDRVLFFVAGSFMFSAFLFAGGQPPLKPWPNDASTAKAEDVNLEGEKRFRANCGRCHQAPHKLSPSMMRTAIRHMRVRANITDEDMRAILAYMTQ
jgi:mono/diheme cytochrome c family protein